MISFIILTFTIERFPSLIACIDSIEAQAAEETIEILAVIENSEELCLFTQKYISDKGYKNVRVIFDKLVKGLSASRNKGVAESRGDIIAFIDDDATLLPGWAHEAVRAYRDKSVIGVTGPIRPMWEDTGLAWFPPEFYWIFSCTNGEPSQLTEVRNGYGTNMSFRRGVFEKCGKFNESYGCNNWSNPGAEELEFSLRAKRITGGKIIFNPLVQVSHRVNKYRLTSKFIARRSFWEGYAKAKISRRYGKEALSKETALLRMIILGNIKKFYVTVLILACVSFGYLVYKVRDGRGLA